MVLGAEGVTTLGGYIRKLISLLSGHRLGGRLSNRRLVVVLLLLLVPDEGVRRALVQVSTCQVSS